MFQMQICWALLWAVSLVLLSKYYFLLSDYHTRKREQVGFAGRQFVCPHVVVSNFLLFLLVPEEDCEFCLWHSLDTFHCLRNRSPLAVNC